ncbi:MAG: hypothetical protein AVDCRST_MAG83-1706 [uncultured Arthrobacter sp.]|uniref:Uncharacterized protein n=1 Tax=uncultured Arthrobacter sp. TaxID=114050 RepID=A0A6J4I6B5_9MICC|nr:hypothetical protein [uncultured Arthrobacter sp.]CAA9242393.1 MAG: hypothetical protein AVDCRST_MAG83-1706 [uncultured Arthrobacter sp.]
MAEVTISAEREALIYGDGMGQAHVISSPHWRPASLSGSVERRVLAARLRAIADVVDGTVED